jgi:hypothetical protein
VCRQRLLCPPSHLLICCGRGLDNGHNDEVYAFWYASAPSAVQSARLKDSLIGQERDAFWAEKQAFLTATELQEEITKQEAGAAAGK